MERIWAKTALTPAGWREDVLVVVDADGRIEAVGAGAPAEGRRVDVLLPAPANLHSHAFQRAMA
ncbi:MAG: formimidoylglutamate deiminase, partial [Pseudomonadota bacterium]